MQSLCKGKPEPSASAFPDRQSIYPQKQKWSYIIQQAGDFHVSYISFSHVMLSVDTKISSSCNVKLNHKIMITKYVHVPHAGVKSKLFYSVYSASNSATSACSTGHFLFVIIHRHMQSSTGNSSAA